MEVINNNVESIQVGGFWGCAMGCTGACLIGSAAGLTFIAVAVWNMS